MSKKGKRYNSRFEVLGQIESGDLDFSEADLSGLDLSKIKFFKGELFTDSFQPVDLSYANMNKVKLIGAILSGIDLVQTKLIGAKLIGAKLNYANIAEANMSKADLTAADLRAADLVQAKLIGAKLCYANFHSAKMSWINLTEANLTGSDMSRADLTAADLTSADLIQVKLIGAKLSYANFNSAKLSWADLTKANMSAADLHESDLIQAKLVEVDLNRANLHTTKLTGADLSRADMRHACLTHSDFTGAVLTGAKVFGAEGKVVKTEGIICEWLDKSEKGDGSVKWHPEKAGDLPDFFSSSVPEAVLKFRDRLSPEAISGWIVVITALKKFHSEIVKIDNTSDAGEIYLSLPRKQGIIPFVIGLLQYCVQSRLQSGDDAEFHLKELLDTIKSESEDNSYQESFRGVYDVLQGLPPIPPQAREQSPWLLTIKQANAVSVSLNLESGNILMEGEKSQPVHSSSSKEEETPTANTLLATQLPQFIQYVFNYLPSK